MRNENRECQDGRPLRGLKLLLSGEPDLTKKQVWYIMVSEESSELYEIEEYVIIADSRSEIMSYRKELRSLIFHDNNDGKVDYLVVVNEKNIDDLIKKMEDSDEKKSESNILVSNRGVNEKLMKKMVGRKAYNVIRRVMGISGGVDVGYIYEVKNKLEKARRTRGASAFDDARKSFLNDSERFSKLVANHSKETPEARKEVKEILDFIHGNNWAEEIEQ